MVMSCAFHVAKFACRAKTRIQSKPGLASSAETVVSEPFCMVTASIINNPREDGQGQRLMETYYHAADHYHIPVVVRATVRVRVMVKARGIYTGCRAPDSLARRQR